MTVFTCQFQPFSYLVLQPLQMLLISRITGSLTKRVERSRLKAGPIANLQNRLKLVIIRLIAGRIGQPVLSHVTQFGCKLFFILVMSSDLVAGAVRIKLCPVIDGLFN